MYKILLPNPVKRLAVAGFLALAALILFWALAVEAAGDTIRVLSDESKVRFPGNVELNLRVEADSHITEIRLYYRVSPSGTWSSTYPQLARMEEVEAIASLDISGTNYLPPGTELEYYYSILDSAGNVVVTRRESVIYIDDRFPWRTTQAGPLTIYWHDLSERTVNRVARPVEDSIVEVAALLQVDKNLPIRGIIYNSRSEAREAFPYQSQTTTENQIFQGFAFPERGVFVGLGMQTSLLVHESAHLLFEKATSAPGVAVSAWLNEGFASYVEPGSQDGVNLEPRNIDRMPLNNMDTVPGRSSDIRYFYSKAQSVVGYLLETYGEDRFRSFLGELNDRTGEDEALKMTYGFDLEGLDRRWSSTPGQQGQDDPEEPQGSPFPFTYLSSVVIGVLALLVAGLAISGYVTRRLNGRGDDWDGLTDEEWQERP